MGLNESQEYCAKFHFQKFLQIEEAIIIKNEFKNNLESLAGSLKIKNSNSKMK